MPSSIDDSELARLEKELLDIPEDSVQKAGADDPEEEKERMRGRRRGKRRREESPSSESSSDSFSSESESETDSSSETVSSEDEADFRKRRSEPLKKKYNPVSPLELARPIPKKIDFAGAVKEAPEIVRMEYKKLRTRVDIDQPLLEHFNKCAAGVYVGTEERLNFFDRLPLVSSGLAAPPVLDEGLPRKSFRIQVDEPSLMADAEVLLNGLNLMAIARSEGRAGRQEKLISTLNKQWKSFGVEPVKIVHNFHRFPVEEPIRSADLPWNEVCPALMGPKLTTEIVEKSQCRKLTEALVKEAKSKKSHSSGKKKPASKKGFERFAKSHLGGRSGRDVGEGSYPGNSMERRDLALQHLRHSQKERVIKNGD
ncbi:hypothetical protein Aduo_001156 [Ancylostoma duodenale]